MTKPNSDPSSFVPCPSDHQTRQRDDEVSYAMSDRVSDRQRMLEFAEEQVRNLSLTLSSLFLIVLCEPSLQMQFQFTDWGLGNEVTKESHMNRSANPQKHGRSMQKDISKLLLPDLPPCYVFKRGLVRFSLRRGD